MRRLTTAAACIAVVVCASCGGFAQASVRSAEPTASESMRVEAARISLPNWIKNVARRWAVRFAKRVGKEAGDQALDAATEWILSGGTECSFPFPQRFCSSRWRTSAPGPVWGLGEAMWYYGRPPGVWSRPFGQRYEISRPLVPGTVYWLTCWTIGDRVYGPWGSNDLWYRVTNGGYTPDALLYTGTNYAIPGVRRC